MMKLPFLFIALDSPLGSRVLYWTQLVDITFPLVHLLIYSSSGLKTRFILNSALNGN